MSDCSYCGNMVDGWLRHCAGCGSPRSAKPIDNQDRAFAKIGRAVVARNPDGVIDWLERHQPRSDESLERCWSRRSSKAFVAIALLFLFPQLLILAAVLGIAFAFYVYLPYRGVRLMFDWITK